ncbi:MAG: HD domain-containing protein [Acidimicrobiales bacterium]
MDGVAERARRFGSCHDLDTADLLVAAGYLHDIGYAEPVHDTGFHPVDGARYLRRLGYDERLVTLVARHTCARIEAELWNLDHVMDDEFPDDPSLPHDELLFCDLTTSPEGYEVSVGHRLADIRRRYPPSSFVVQFVERAEPDLLAGAWRAQAILDGDTQGRLRTSLSVPGIGL